MNLSAFIIAIVENTEEFTFDEENCRGYGEIELSLADCNDKVSYFFNLNSAEQRSNSLYKIRRVAKAINEFHEAIEKEARLIASHEKANSKNEKAKSAKA